MGAWLDHLRLSSSQRTGVISDSSRGIWSGSAILCTTSALKPYPSEEAVASNGSESTTQVPLRRAGRDRHALKPRWLWRLTQTVGTYCDAFGNSKMHLPKQTWPRADAQFRSAAATLFEWSRPNAVAALNCVPSLSAAILEVRRLE